MEIAMTIQPIAILLLTLLLTGCASQSEVNDLKKQIENMKTERAQRQQELQRDIDQAQTDLDR